VNYDLACSPAAIQTLAETSLDLIRSAGTVPQYDHSIPTPEQVLTLNLSEPLAKLLNAAMGVLLLQPESYRGFQDRLLKELIQNQS
jgi:hypothetical protein